MAEILVEGPTVHERGNPSEEITVTNFHIVDAGKKLFTADYYQSERDEPFYSAYWPSTVSSEAFWSSVEGLSQELEAELGIQIGYEVYHYSGERTAVQRPLSAEDLYRDPTVIATPGFMRIWGPPSVGSFILDRSGIVSEKPYLNVLTSLNKPDQLCRFIEGNSGGNIPEDLLREVLAEVGNRSQVRLAELRDAEKMPA